MQGCKILLLLHWLGRKQSITWKNIQGFHASHSKKIVCSVLLLYQGATDKWLHIHHSIFWPSVRGGGKSTLSRKNRYISDIMSFQSIGPIITDWPLLLKVNRKELFIGRTFTPIQSGQILSGRSPNHDIRKIIKSSNVYFRKSWVRLIKYDGHPSKIYKMQLYLRILPVHAAVRSNFVPSCHDGLECWDPPKLKSNFPSKLHYTFFRNMKKEPTLEKATKHPNTRECLRQLVLNHACR